MISETWYFCERCKRRSQDIEEVIACEESHPEEGDYELFKVGKPFKPLSFGLQGEIPVAKYIDVQAKGKVYRYSFESEVDHLEALNDR